MKYEYDCVNRRKCKNIYDISSNFEWSFYEYNKIKEKWIANCMIYPSSKLYRNEIICNEL